MDGIGGTEWRGTMAFTTLRRHPCAQLMAPTGGTAAPGGRSLRVSLEPLQHQRPLARVLVVGEQPIPVQAREHVHLFQHVEQRRHGPAREVGLRRGAGVLATSVELADEEERLDGREGDPELADRAVGLLAVEEANRDLARRGLRSQVLVAGQLHPLHRRERDPGGLVVLQTAGIVDLDQEVGLVEVEVASHPLEGFVVEKPDDYLCHRITYSTNPHLAGVLRTARRPNRREHRAHPAMWLRTASAWLRRSLPARYGANNGATSSWVTSAAPSAARYSSLNRRRAR